MLKPPRLARILLILLMGAAAWGVENYAVNISSPTKKPAAKSKHKMPRPLKELRAISVKVLSSNPQFQGPTTRSMPPTAPLTPKLTAPVLPPEPTGSERFFKAAASVMTTTWSNNIFVWLPAFSTDPNTGPTFGVLPVLVLSDNVTHHIRHLVAPSYTYNKILGQTVTGRYYFYPTDRSQLFSIASYSQHTNQEFKLRYEDSAFLDGRAFIRGEGYYDVDGALRFYGVGPNTISDNETGYTGYDKVFRGTMGVNFMKNLRLSAGASFRRLGIGPTVVPNIRSLTDITPTLASQPEQNTVVQELHLLWDTRDFPVTPSKGSTGEMFFEKTTQSWGSDSDYIRYGIEGRRLFPWPSRKHTTAIHGLYDWMNGSDIPFHQLASLGGRDTLRGFGEGRFRDQGRLVFNAEHRIEFSRIEMMGVVTKFEAGPFFDIGTVFHRAEDMQTKDLQPVIGGSFRAVVHPNVVGSVDVGVGKEGVATFVDINYPF